MDGRDTSTLSNDVRDVAIERMMKQYGAAVYRMCYLYLHDRTLAEDAGQDTFIKAYRSLGTFEGKYEKSEKAWLMRIAINTCKDHRRSAWFRTRISSQPLERLPDPAYEVDEQSRLITEEIIRLPVKLKEVILLYYYQSLTYDEITHVLGISKTTVFQRMKKARQLLKRNLEGWCDDEEPGHQACD